MYTIILQEQLKSKVLKQSDSLKIFIYLALRSIQRVAIHKTDDGEMLHVVTAPCKKNHSFLNRTLSSVSPT